MKENKSIYLTDNPNIEQDSFQVHTNISETLFDIIKKHTVNKNSFTIGLFGEWGSGKSYIVNKLAENIKKNDEKKITYLYIDIWKYSGFPLLRSILFDLNKQFRLLSEKNGEKYKAFSSGYKKNGQNLQYFLKYDKQFKDELKLTPKESWDKIYFTLKKYRIIWIIFIVLFLSFIIPLFLPFQWKDSSIYKELSPLLKVLKYFVSFTGISSVFLLLLKTPLTDLGKLVFFRSIVRDYTEKANFSPEQFESIFNDMLSKIKDEKYVIVFDNLDRCEPNIAYETLSTIKTFMDIKNCIYIIPADDEAIKKYLSNFKYEENNDNNTSFQRKFAEEFIDKIFQTYIRIPILKEVERDNYIKEQLEKIDFKDKLKVEDIETITQILYFAYKGESPRNIIRFINDYSTYFQLALNSLPNLLDNITLFTIMIAIKQKWYQFERTLIENPNFFSEYINDKKIIESFPIENKNDLEKFLDSISTYYIPQIKNKSFNSYIHFKESEKSFEITETLKNKQPVKFVLNEESVKVLIKEFNRIIGVKGEFTTNSFLSFAYLICSNIKQTLRTKLIKEFWIGFIKTPNEQIKPILGELLEDKVLIDIFNTLEYPYLSYNKIKIEQKIISYLYEPINNDSEFEEYEKVFDEILKSKYKFNPSKLKLIFSQWKKENQYLNSLLNIISKKEKPEYLPNNVLAQLINNNIDAISLSILKNWDCDSIPKDYGVKLLEITLNRLKSRNFVNQPQLQQHKPNIEQDYEIILLLDISFVNNDKKADFFQNLAELTNKIFQFASNQQLLFELGVKFWLEIVYFANLDNAFIDSKLLEIFDIYIKPNQNILSFLNENIKYPEDILSLVKTKQTIFNTSTELQTKIYEKLDNKYFTNYNLITSLPIVVTHIDNLLNYSNKKNIDIEKTKLSGFLLKEIILELINKNTDISDKLKYLCDKFELNAHKKVIIDNKNGIIDYYKANSTIAINVLIEIKSILTYSEFFNNILKPVLIYVNSELNKSESIVDFTNLSKLIEVNKNEKDIELLYSVLKQCLEKNQTLEENYFGIEILEKVYSKISKEKKKEIGELIINNDKHKQWDKKIIEKITKLK